MYNKIINVWLNNLYLVLNLNIIVMEDTHLKRKVQLVYKIVNR